MNNNAFDLAAFTAVLEQTTNKAQVELDEAKKRDQRITFLNGELDNINKVLIPAKHSDIDAIVANLATIDAYISNLKRSNVKNPELIGQLNQLRKEGIAGMEILRKELDILKYRAQSMAKEKSELTKIARGMAVVDAPATKIVHNDHGSFGTLSLAVKNS